MGFSRQSINFDHNKGQNIKEVIFLSKCVSKAARTRNRSSGGVQRRGKRHEHKQQGLALWTGGH